LQTLIKDDPGVRIVQKEFPILGPTSVYAARVALAAQKQGKYRQFHDAMMAKKPNIDEATILQVADAAGLDIDRIKADMNSPEVDSELQRGQQIARALKLEGTPGFIVGTELVPGATDLVTLKSMVDDVRHGIN
jgi:protein-disulfide isomerase